MRTFVKKEVAFLLQSKREELKGRLLAGQKDQKSVSRRMNGLAVSEKRRRLEKLGAVLDTKLKSITADLCLHHFRLISGSAV